MICFRFFVPVVCCCCAADSVDAVIADIPAGGNYFRIRAVDRKTGRGIPMVRFTADSASIDYYTDSAGVIAFGEAGLMGADVYFRVEGFGYQIPLNEHPSGGSRRSIAQRTVWPYRVVLLPPSPRQNLRPV